MKKMTEICRVIWFILAISLAVGGHGVHTVLAQEEILSEIIDLEDDIEEISEDSDSGEEILPDEVIIEDI